MPDYGKQRFSLATPRIPQKAAVPKEKKKKKKKELTPAEEAARVDALMAKGLAAGRVEPEGAAAKTPAQVRGEAAAARRDKVQPGFLRLLSDALTGKKRKK